MTDQRRTALTGLIALIICLPSGTRAASALPTSSTAVPSSAVLNKLTESAFRRMKTIHYESGMAGLTEAVQTCYKKLNRSRLSLFECMQLDYFSMRIDSALVSALAKDQEAAERLRAPYFQDVSFKARREVHSYELAGDRADELSAALFDTRSE